jgi:hypothetical protein
MGAARIVSPWRGGLRTAHSSGRRLPALPDRPCMARPTAHSPPPAAHRPPPTAHRRDTLAHSPLRGPVLFLYSLDDQLVCACGSGCMLLGLLLGLACSLLSCCGGGCWLRAWWWLAVPYGG